MTAYAASASLVDIGVSANFDEGKKAVNKASKIVSRIQKELVQAINTDAVRTEVDRQFDLVISAVNDQLYGVNTSFVNVAALLKGVHQKLMERVNRDG